MSPSTSKSGKHYPFTKDRNIPLYVCNKFNHPPSILKKTFLKQLTSVFPNYLLIKNALTRPKAFIRRYLIKAAMITTSYSRNSRMILPTHPETAQGTFFGLIFHTVKMLKPKWARSSFHSLIRISVSPTLSTKSSTVTH